MLIGPQGPPWWIFFQNFFKNVLVYPQLTQKYVLWHSKLEKSILGSRELMINPIYYYSGEVQCVHGSPPPLPNICHKIGYFASSFMIFTFSASHSHQKYYFKGLRV